MKKSDLDAWTPEEPPSDFAERVVRRALAERRPNRTRPAAKWAAGVAAALALAAGVILVIGQRPPSMGTAIAPDRTEVRIGKRAIAVLEAGAEVSWHDDEVIQNKGDVFYRVEPGATFHVETPAGQVAVLGTCFRVKVQDAPTKDEGTMKKRDGLAGVVGAAIGAVVVVGVYEGHVRASQAGQQVDLAAGEAARLDDRGARRAGDASALDDALAAPMPSDSAYADANKNLADTVRDLDHRLGSLDKQKQDLEKKLATAQADLAAAVRDGKARPLRNEFDLTADDWAELAKNGTIKYRVPCYGTTPWKPGPKVMDKVGIAPDDVPAIQDAYAKSNKRLWSQIKPLCAKTIGSADVAEKLGPDTCTHLILNVAEAENGDAANEARRMVGEIRAGKRPAPGPNDTAHPVLKLFLALTAETGAFEADLAQDFGPEEGHRLAYAQGMCVEQSTFSGGPPAPAGDAQ